MDVSIATVGGVENTINSYDGASNHVCFKDCERSRSDMFNCGVCSQVFDSICHLHEHLQTKHSCKGCYNYNSLLRTAFPKYDTVCCFTQTVDDLDVDLRPADSLVNSSSLNTYNSNRKRRKKKDDLNVGNYSETVVALGSSNCKVNVEENLKKANEKRFEGTSVSDLKDTDRKSILKSCTNKRTNTNVKNIDNYQCKDSNKLTTKRVKTANTMKIRNKRIKTERTVDKLKTTKTLPTKDAMKRSRKTLPVTRSKSNCPKSLPNKSRQDKVGKELSSAEIQLSAMEMENMNVVSVISTTKCPSCSEMVPMDELKQHMKTKHLEKTLFPCHLCQNHFTNQEDLNTHVSDEHSKGGNAGVDKVIAHSEDLEKQTEAGKKNKKCMKKSEESKLPYTCSICCQVMPGSKKDVHSRLHSGERPYICHLCGKGLISQDKLKRHMLIHSEVKKHTCEVCGAGFQMKYKLRMHMHIHTGKKPYLCSICGAEFNHSSNLATHTRCVHLQIKPFECTVCGGRYAKRSQLDDHALSHSSERQFTCRFCGKSFKYLKGMKRHEKSHQDDTVHRCEKCDLKFTDRETFTEHINTVHTTQPIKCTECKKTFRDKAELEEHKDAQCDSKKYQCAICGEHYKVCNKYYTHMLAAHGIEREQAKFLHAQSKHLKNIKFSGQRGGVSPLHQTLAVPVTTPPSITNSVGGGNKVTNTVSSVTPPTFSVRQMVTGLLEENRTTISALTRAATENLRLHSQDIPEEEKLGAIIPPLNPLIALDRSQSLNNFGVSGDATLIDPSRSVIDTASVMHINSNIHMETGNPSLATVSRDGLILPDRNSGRISLINMSETIGINHDGGFLGRMDDRYQAVNASLIPIQTTLTTGQDALLVHESNMALRRLAENTDSQDVTQTMLTGSDTGLLPVSTDQRDPRNNQSEAQSVSIGYQIQNLY